MEATVKQIGRSVVENGKHRSGRKEPRSSRMEARSPKMEARRFNNGTSGSFSRSGSRVESAAPGTYRPNPNTRPQHPATETVTIRKVVPAPAAPAGANLALPTAARAPPPHKGRHTTTAYATSVAGFPAASRYRPVIDRGFAATSSGVPTATISPPPSPPSGPRSMT